MTASPTRVLARTRRRLFAVTLGLVALLVVGIGAASAFVALRALDAEVDRALAATVDRAVFVLSEAGSGTTPAPPSGVDGDGGDDDQLLKMTHANWSTRRGSRCAGTGASMSVAGAAM